MDLGNDDRSLLSKSSSQSLDNLSRKRSRHQTTEEDAIIEESLERNKRREYAKELATSENFNEHETEELIGFSEV
jgi:hypothetical protein